MDTLISVLNVICDTSSIPLTLTGLTHPEDIDLILHYDGTMDYLGSFSPTGCAIAAYEDYARAMIHAGFGSQNSGPLRRQ